MKFQVSLVCCCLILATAQCCWARATARQTVRPPLQPHHQQAICEEVHVPLCTKVGWSGSTSRKHMREVEELGDYEIIIKSCCSNATIHFLCSHYTPFCSGGVTLPPCREFCEYVRDGCESQYEKMSMSWPKHMQCDTFPSHTTSNSNCIPLPPLDQLQTPPEYECNEKPTTVAAQQAAPSQPATSTQQAASSQPATSAQKAASSQPPTSAQKAASSQPPTSAQQAASSQPPTSAMKNQAPTVKTRPRTINRKSTDPSTDKNPRRSFS